MTRILIGLLWLVSFSASAQLATSANRIYRNGDQVVVTTATGDSLKSFSASVVKIQSNGAQQVYVTVNRQLTRFPLAKFLNQAGSPYSTVSGDAALAAYLAAIPSGGSSTTGVAGVSSINGETGAVTGYAKAVSPAFTGTPTAPTASTGTGTNQIATTNFVQNAVGPLIASINQNVSDIQSLTTKTASNSASAANAQATANGHTTQISSLSAGKQSNLVSGTNIKTINGNSLLGSGDVVISGGGSAVPSLVSIARRNMGFVFPAFVTANKFDSPSTSPALTIASSGTGMVTSTDGADAFGSLKFPKEIEPRMVSRTDVRLALNNAASGKITVEFGGSGSSGYVVVVETNVSGNLRVTLPSGTAVSYPMSGTFNANISFATANMGITSSFHVLGNPTSLATVTNGYRVPIYEYALCNKPQLWGLYLKTNTTSSSITGASHNNKTHDGDPGGQFLTRTMVMHSSGFVGWNNGVNRDNDTYYIIPERSVPTAPIKIANFQHQNTGRYIDFLNISLGDKAETARQLLLNGYIISSSNGGLAQTTKETDSWGSPTAMERADELYHEIVKNVSNTGKEYLIGWSMGSGVQLNYLKTFGYRIGAVWLSCPAIDFEETGTNSLQANTALKNALDRAYAPWYLATATTTADPRTDLTGWRQVSQPGALPPLGVRLSTVTRITSAVTNSNVVVPETGANVKQLLMPGDELYFKYSGQSRRYALSFYTNANIQLDAPITTVANELVSVIKSGASPAYEYAWVNKSSSEWSAGSKAAGEFSYRVSATPETDVRPHNPARFTDVYAQLGVPIHIYYSSSTNDGILNRAPIDVFKTSVNSSAGTTIVTGVAVDGEGHLGAGTMNSADVISTFNAN